MAFILAIPGVAAHHSIHTVGGSVWVVVGADAVIILRVPVVNPLCNISDNVMNSVSVRRKRAHGHRTFRPAVMSELLFTTAATTRSAASGSTGRQLIAPWITLSVGSTAGRFFPFRLSRQ